jgi:hypothetical protein
MVQEGASELVISVAAKDVGISKIDARSEVSDFLRRLAGDSIQHADTGGLEEVVGGVDKFADIVEHFCNKRSQSFKFAWWPKRGHGADLSSLGGKREDMDQIMQRMIND